MRNGRRLLSIFLSLLMVLSVIPLAGVSAFARSLDDGQSSGYTVTLSSDKHGDVSFTDAGASSKDYDVGDVVRLRLEPDAGYEVDKLQATYKEQGITYELSVDSDTAAFRMPSENVALTAAFREASSQYLTGYPIQALAYIRQNKDSKGSSTADITYNVGSTGTNVSNGKPDLNAIWSNGLCCGSYVGYFYYNYLPNVAKVGNSIMSILNSIRPGNLASAPQWEDAWDKGVKAGTVVKVDNFSSDVPVGALCFYGTHVAVYAGHIGSTYFVTHVSGADGHHDPELASFKANNPGSNHLAYANYWDYYDETASKAISTVSNDSDYGIMPMSAGGELEAIYYLKDVDLTAPQTGDFSLTKVSANTAYTNGNSSYGALTDSVFTLTGPTEGKSVAYDLTYDTKTKSWHKEDLPIGTYVLTEKTAPKNFGKINAMSVKIVAGSEPIKVTVNEPVNPTEFKIVKKTYTDSTALVKGNSNYSLANAKFKLVSTWGNGAVTKTLTTDANGKTSTVDIPYGTYTLTETAAPKGYEISPSLKRGVTITIGNTPAPTTGDAVVSRGSDGVFTCTVYDPVVNDPPGVILNKLDANFNSVPSGDGSLAGAKFEVRLFDTATLTDAQVKSGNYDGQILVKFIVTTDENGQVMCDESHISNFWSKNGTSLGNWFDETGWFRFPFGTINIRETSPSEGYLADTVPIVPQSSSIDDKFVSYSNNSFTVNWCQACYNEYGTPDFWASAANVPTAIEDGPLTGGFEIRKADNQSHESWGQGDAELSATFNVYSACENKIVYRGATKSPGDFIMTITANKSNKYVASTPNDLPYGSYRVVEVSTSDNYKLSEYMRIIDIHPNKNENGKMYSFTTKDFAENPVKRGGVSVTKFTQDFFAAEPEGDAMLKGAEFTIYNKSENPVYDLSGHRYEVNEAVTTLTTDDHGFATTGANYLPIGTYLIKETKASKGYLLNTVWEKTFSITSEGQVVNYSTIPTSSSGFDFGSNNAKDTMANAEAVIKGGVRIYKSDTNRIETDAQRDGNKAQGDASLEGAVFAVRNMSSHAVRVNGQTFEPNQICLTLTTNKQGVAQSSADALPFGTYEITEMTKTNANGSPEGYFTDSDWSATIYIRDNGVIVNANAYINNPVKEDIYRGGFKFLKIDAERNEAVPQGDATLEGALFYVTNKSKTDVFVNGAWYAPGEVCYTFKTDKNGAYESSPDALPYGSYRITESAPSKGYLLNKDYHVDFQIRENHRIYDLTGNPCGEKVIRGDVQILKYDAEINKSAAIGGKNHGDNEYGTDLSGIKFAIVNSSKELVIVDGVRYQPGEVCKTIVTHWNDAIKAYSAETTGRTFPYGTYTVYEVKSDLSTNNDDKVNEYYLRNDAVLTFQIREDGKTVKLDVDDNTLVFKNQVVRADIEFRKIADSTSARMNTAWVLTNDTTGERHVIIADENGEFYSAANRVKHTTNTNCNDSFLERIDAGERIAMSEFTVRNRQGVWFGLAEDGSVAKPNDNLRALPYGRYTLSEVPTDSNEGYTLQEFKFFVYENNQVVDIGTITDDKVSVYTTLIDEDTLGHVAFAQKLTVLTDTVEYRGLTEGKTYTVSGKLVDKATKETVATASVDFKSKSDGKVEVSYSFDATKLAGHDVVAFESIIDKATGYKVAEHADINDTDQTVSFPKISTTATSDLTKDHDAPSMGKVVITDVVKYSNLVPGKKYTVNGVLMNKETGDEIFDAHGREVTASTQFVPTESSGSVSLTFEFDAAPFAGQTVVVFETLEFRKTTVAAHYDINDESQSVHIPEIGTTAIFGVTNMHEGAPMTNAVIEDTVEYHNLLAGKQYKLVGVLMNKATGKPVVDAKGNEVTAEKMFTASSVNGSVAISFNFDSTKLAGTETVVFETLYRNNVEMAEHKDINDENQTVRFPWIGTKANYLDTDIQEGLAADNAVITDHVEYKLLTAGSEYVMTGVLMDKDSGAAVLDKNGNPVTAQTKFTPSASNGTVDVVFKFDASMLAGHTVTVFEALKHNDIEVAVHRDINDVEQSVKFPKIGTVLTNSETGLDEVKADEKYVLTDTVKYENLTIGHEYTVTAVLVDKETGKNIGKEVTVKFVPETENGSMTVDIPFDASDMADKSVVAFETFAFKNVIVAEHKDVDDDDQTVTVPEIGTTAVSSLTGDNEGMLVNDYRLTDTVTYKNLVTGRSYTLSGVIMDRATGEALVGTDGNIITSSVGFVPESADGEIDVEFVFDSTQLGGKDIVVFETLTRANVVLAAHKDIEDENQTIHFPAIGTSALFGDTPINEGSASEKTGITDTVKYSNLREGEEYTVIGTLVDRTTGEAVTVGEGDDAQSVTAQTTFTPDKADGEIVVTFEFDATAYSGHTLVAYESLVRSGFERAYHKDVNDEAQSIYLAEIDTTLTEKQSGIHEALASGEITLVDSVTYTNLVIGNTYTVNGVLMDKTTNEPVKDVDGNEITATAEFTPETNDGIVNIEFTFDASEFAGRTVVAFDEIVREDTVIVEHKDIDDTDQTVSFPKIGTTAVDSLTGTHMLSDSDGITITDTVEYSNLIVGQEYSLAGVLMDKETGKAFTVETEDGETPVMAFATFTPEETEGTTDVDFVVMSSALTGKTLVAFETLLVTDIPVAEHKDINDDAQTVHNMTMKTLATAADGRSKTVDISNKAVIVDKIEYTNLVPGVEYVIGGSVVYAEDGRLAKTADGKDTVVEAVFTPDKPDGTVEVEFTVDTSKSNGKTLVCYETVYDNDVAIGSHIDINDKDQSVTVKTETKLKTGVTNYAGILAMTLVAVLALSVIALVFRKIQANRRFISKYGK